MFALTYAVFQLELLREFEVCNLLVRVPVAAGGLFAELGLPAEVILYPPTFMDDLGIPLEASSAEELVIKTESGREFDVQLGRVLRPLREL